MSRQALRDPERLGPLIGLKLLEITDEPDDDRLESGNDYAHFHFEAGYTLVVDFVHSSFRLEVPE